MAFQSIEADWQGFADKVLPPTASEVQRTEMKKAFFAGAWVMFCTVKEIGEPEITEAVAHEHLNALETEFLAYFRLQRG